MSNNNYFIINRLNEHNIQITLALKLKLDIKAPEMKRKIHILTKFKPNGHQDLQKS